MKYLLDRIMHATALSIPIVGYRLEWEKTIIGYFGDLIM